MKRLLILPLLLLSLSLGGQSLWYVATAANGGDDDDGDGSAAHPWLTVKHAADTVTGAAFSNDTIMVGVGTFTEPDQITLGVLINLKGAGVTSIITTAAALDPLLYLYSAVQGTDGSQSISHLYFNGNTYTGKSAINVVQRDTVIIHDCTVTGFDIYGIQFNGGGGDTGPALYSTGSMVYDCYIYNNAGTYGEHGGELKLGGQKNMDVYNNTIIRPSRGDDAGFGIKFANYGFLQGVRVFDNYIAVPPKGTSSWSMAVEFHNSRGGIEVYNNVIKGTIDFGCNTLYINNDEGGYGFAGKVYNNKIGQDQPEASNISGVDFERNMSGGFHIFNNEFNNISTPIRNSVQAGEVVEDIYIYYNRITNVGNTASNQGFGINIGNAVAVTYDNINIWNNTIIAAPTAVQPLDGIRLDIGSGTNFSIRNNLISGFDNDGVYFLSSEIDGISIENNLVYAGGTIDIALAVLTNSTIQNNLAVNPLFKSNETFRLRPTSPAIDAGLNVGLTHDYHGHRITGTPDIGASELGNYVLFYNGKQLR